MVAGVAAGRVLQPALRTALKCVYSGSFAGTTENSRDKSEEETRALTGFGAVTSARAAVPAQGAIASARGTPKIGMPSLKMNRVIAEPIFQFYHKRELTFLDPKSDQKGAVERRI
jgi:hypothetical protein